MGGPIPICSEPVEGAQSGLCSTRWSFVMVVMGVGMGMVMPMPRRLRAARSEFTGENDAAGVLLLG